MKRILIIGPIGDIGGREVEVNIIARALENNYRVMVFSTGFMTQKSFAIEGLQNTDYKVLDKELFKKYIGVKLVSLFSWMLSGFKNNYIRYVSNNWNKKLFDLNKKREKEIVDYLMNCELVILPMQLSSTFSELIVTRCKELNIPTLFRTTGTINEINDVRYLNDVSCFVHHSKSNALRLDSSKTNYCIIDQCSLNEKLLNLPIETGTSLRFGFLGRFSEEKGIMDLIDYVIKCNDLILYLVGDGEQKADVLRKIENVNTIRYLGVLNNEDLEMFFEKIDVLIIPSKEETGPLVGLEAMAAGKIILSTKVGAMMERLENTENQFWFENTEASFVREINKLSVLSEKQLSKIKTKNRERYLERYSKEVISSSYLELVNKLINENRR
jgi:glycosyltransferase involved in cell wall biosynthesis